MMKPILVGALIGLAYFLFDNALDRQYNRGFAEGRGMALKTNPPSEELELVCAGLWIGEQNKKAWKKQNAR
jgi:hypothetical protein